MRFKYFTTNRAANERRMKGTLPKVDRQSNLLGHHELCGDVGELF